MKKPLVTHLLKGVRGAIEDDPLPQMEFFRHCIEATRNLMDEGLKQCPIMTGHAKTIAHTLFMSFKTCVLSNGSMPFIKQTVHINSHLRNPVHGIFFDLKFRHRVSDTLLSCRNR